jgi:hypothetical protein
MNRHEVLGVVLLGVAALSWLAADVLAKLVAWFGTVQGCGVLMMAWPIIWLAVLRRNH